MIALEIPEDSTDPIQLADWLELQAIVAADGNASQGDLEAILRIPSVLESYGDLEAPNDLELSNGLLQANEDADDDRLVEEKTQEVFSELEMREKAAPDAYPFHIDPYGVLQLRSDWTDFPSYVFCLCLSYFEWVTFRKGESRSSKLFEELSCLAAERYFGGQAVNFGAPRTRLPSPFPEAINKLCVLIGEGDGYRAHSGLQPQDDKLDVVVWKDSPDGLPGKLLVFGQCAAGKKWHAKLTEMQADEFAKFWIRNDTYSKAVRSFFVPHRVTSRGAERWEYAVTYGGIFFDRCRIAFWAHGAKGIDYSPYLNWVKKRFSELSSVA
jgi:hypothetical protein